MGRLDVPFIGRSIGNFLQFLKQHSNKKDGEIFVLFYQAKSAEELALPPDEANASADNESTGQHLIVFEELHSEQKKCCCVVLILAKELVQNCDGQTRKLVEAATRNITAGGQCQIAQFKDIRCHFGCPSCVGPYSQSCLRHLGLLRPIYQRTAENGHFGNEEFPWEKPKALALPKRIREKLREMQKMG